MSKYNINANTVGRIGDSYGGTHYNAAGNLTVGKGEGDGSPSDQREKFPASFPDEDAAKFRHPIDTSHDLGAIRRICMKAERSVGIISWELQPIGTGFRVGSRYVMTCHHVIVSGGSDIPLHQLGINFDNTTYNNEYYEDKLPTFTFSRVVYRETERDVAILELTDNDVTPPPSLPLVRKVEKNQDVYLIGHPGGKVKKFDKVTFVDPDDKTLKRQQSDFMNWKRAIESKRGSVFKFHDISYDGLRDSNFVVFHCYFAHGASGSPGVFISKNDGQVYVSVMLSKGNPPFYYRGIEDEELRKMVPSDYLYELGVDMAALYREMGDSEMNKSLLDDIFPMA